MQPKERLADGLARADHRLEHSDRHGSNDSSHGALERGIKIPLETTDELLSPRCLIHIPPWEQPR